MVYTVSCGGLDLSSLVQRIDLKWDFRSMVPEATIELTDLPTAVTYWQDLKVSAGLHSTGGDTKSDFWNFPTTGLPRFDGYVTPLSSSLFPTVPKIVGRGALILMERLVCPDDLENQHQSNPLTNPADYKFDAPGIDLSFDPGSGNPWTDADMITYLLGQCGLGGRIVSGGILGTGRYLGTIVPESFTWRRGSPALGYAADLDEMGLGFRLYERIAFDEVSGGATSQTIARAQCSPRTPFLNNRITFTEGADIFDDAHIDRSAIDEKNRVVVTGVDIGGTPESFVLVGAVSNLPPNVLWETDTTASPMIELSEIVEVIANDGVSCEDVAIWRQQEVAHEIIEVTFSTWRDDAVSLADTVYVNAPHLLGINQSLWVTGVNIIVDAGRTPTFTQRITAWGIAQRDRAGNLLQLTGRALLPMVLPSRLAIGMGAA